MNEVRFYAWDCPPEKPESLSSPDGVTVRIERPRTFDSILPKRYALWGLWHLLHFFRNREYSICWVYESGQMTHRSAIFPLWWRFRFMAPNDLQVGDTWTELEARGKGHASLALQTIQRSCWAPNRRLWYLVEEDNHASIRVVEKAGFQLVGKGTKIHRIPGGLLDEYQITSPAKIEGNRMKKKPVYDAVKRVLDILFASAVLLVASPIILALVLWIKLDSPGPAFYRGRRVGKDGKEFLMWKFRSMVVNADKNGPASTGNNDSRITRAGKFVRKFKFDEIPQFINVFTGDMSVVGPRPDVSSMINRLSEKDKAIVSIRPGIADYGTIWNHDEGRLLASSLDPDEDYFRFIMPIKTALSLEYIRTRSLFVDLKIMIAAFAAAFLRMDPRWCLPASVAAPQLDDLAETIRRSQPTTAVVESELTPVSEPTA